MSAVVFPIATIRRSLRPLPSAVVSESTIRDQRRQRDSANRPTATAKPAIGKTPLNDIFRVDFTTLTLAFPNLPETGTA